MPIQPTINLTPHYVNPLALTLELKVSVPL